MPASPEDTTNPGDFTVAGVLRDHEQRIRVLERAYWKGVGVAAAAASAFAFLGSYLGSINH